MKSLQTYLKKEFAYVDSDIARYFPDEEIGKGEVLNSAILEKDTTEQEILDTHKGTLVTWSDIIATFKAKKLVENGYANLFFVKKDDAVLVARVGRYSVGWHVYVYRFDYSNGWRAGRHSFFRNSDTLDPFPHQTSEYIENRLSKLESQMEKIINLFNNLK